MLSLPKYCTRSLFPLYLHFLHLQSGKQCICIYIMLLACCGVSPIPSECSTTLNSYTLITWVLENILHQQNFIKRIIRQIKILSLLIILLIDKISITIISLINISIITSLFWQVQNRQNNESWVVKITSLDPPKQRTTSSTFSQKLKKTDSSN